MFGLDSRFKIHTALSMEFAVRGKSFGSISHQKSRTKKKSKNFSKNFGKARQETVSKITKSFTTHPIFKKKHSFKPTFRKKNSKKDILKKYRKFSEKGKKLDFSCKNRTLVKIKTKTQPLKPRRTFSLRKKKVNFSKKQEIGKEHLSTLLRKKTSFPKKISKRNNEYRCRHRN